MGRVRHDAHAGRREDRAEHDTADELPVIGPVIPVAHVGMIVPVLVPVIIVIGPVLVPVLIPVLVVVVFAPIFIVVFPIAIVIFPIAVLAPVLVVVVSFVPVRIFLWLSPTTILASSTAITSWETVGRRKPSPWRVALAGWLAETMQRPAATAMPVRP